MEPEPHAEEQTATAPATLGAVLYSGKYKTLVSEKDWVALVRAIAGGDQLALHALYERANRLVYTLSLRITSNRELAEEITVDVFHDVWRRASSYDPVNGTVLGWIMNQARSRSIDRLRFEQRKKRQAVPVGGEGAVVADAHHVLELRQQSEGLRNALRVLTPDERRAIEEAFFAERTYADVALVLNQPLGTIKTRIRSALQKLRQVLSAGEQR